MPVELDPSLRSELALERSEGMTASYLFTDTAWRQRTHQRAHHGQVFLTTRETLAHQVIRCRSQVALLQRHIGTEAIEEGQLEVGRLAQCAMRTDLDAVAAEDTAVESEGITV